MIKPPRPLSDIQIDGLRAMLNHPKAIVSIHEVETPDGLREMHELRRVARESEKRRAKTRLRAFLAGLALGAILANSIVAGVLIARG